MPRLQQKGFWEYFIPKSKRILILLCSVTLILGGCGNTRSLERARTSTFNRLQFVTTSLPSFLSLFFSTFQ